jgi:hypothetical protein
MKGLRCSALWSAVTVLFFAVALAVSPAMLPGCGGGGDSGKKKSSKKKKGSKKKKSSKKKTEEPAMDENALKIDEMVENIKADAEYILKEGGTYEDVWNIEKKVNETAEEIKKLGGDKTGAWDKWRKLIKAKVLADPLKDRALGYANENPTDFDGVIAKFKEVIDYLEEVGEKESKAVIARMEKEIALVGDLKIWTAKSPTDDMDLIAMGKSGFEEWGNAKDQMSVSWSGGEIKLSMGEAKSYAYLTAKHAFWKDYEAQIDFTVHSGEVTIIHRHIPGKASTHYHAAADSETFQGKVELTFEMIGESLKVLDPEGNEMDHIVTDKGNPGGGISFRMSPNSRVTLHRIQVIKR